MAGISPYHIRGCSLFSEENMPIIVQKAWYTRAQLQSQPSDLFAWGDNLARVGGKNNPRSGQAYACRDADRTRVVSGKSVSVRVDIGGGRIMKKKNKHKQ